MRTTSAILAVSFLLGGCASTPQPPAAVASKVGSEPAPIEAEPATPRTAADAPLDWARLEAAVAEAARDKRMKIPPAKMRDAAVAYAKDINRIPVEYMRQYHLNRAALVLEREVFSGETLAEGAALRATVSGGSGGGSRSTGSRGSRDIGRTSRSGNNSGTNRSSGTSNNNNNNNNSNNSGF
jgi:hypothetical protein